jgi:uncharacterized RDD family membrane protein YckC
MSASAAHHHHAAAVRRADFSARATHVSVRRFFAHFIDGVLYSLALVATIFIGVFAAELAGEAAGGVVYAAVIIFALTIGHVWFLVLIHGSDGRSPGKRAFGLRVVDDHGDPPTRGAMWKRSIPAIIEYFYVIAWLGMMSSDYRQRIGDRWADTYVVAE